MNETNTDTDGSRRRNGAVMVNARKRFFLSHKDGRWVLSHEGTPLSYHRTRDEGAHEGRQVARRHAPSQLIVKRLDGTFGEENTYLFDPVSTRG